MPLANAGFRRLDFVTDDEFLATVFERHQGRSYEKMIGFPLFVHLIAECEAGTHLFCPAHGSILPVRVACLDAWPPPKTLDPFHYDPIIRIYTDPGSVVDLRTGIVTPMKSDGLGDAFETIILTTITLEKTV